MHVIAKFPVTHIQKNKKIDSPIGFSFKIQYLILPQAINRHKWRFFETDKGENEDESVSDIVDDSSHGLSRMPAGEKAG